MLKKLIPQLPHLHLRFPSLFQKSHTVGARPGHLQIAPDAPKPTIRLIQYDEGQADDRPLSSLEDIRSLSAGKGVTWIDVQGLGDEPLLRAIAEQFQIHPLALEDMVNAPQLPKIQQYDTGVLWVTRMVRFDDGGALDREQLGIYSTEGVVITFQERPGDVLEPVRKRVLDGSGRIRKAGADYLAYALLDTVVDGYYPVVERISQSLESLDGRVMTTPGPEFLVAVNDTKLLLTMLRRILYAQRDALENLAEDEENGHLSNDVFLYLRDVKDHARQLCDVVDNQKELAMGLLNTYLSMVSYRTNEVMKVLTIMASIFIPLTFVAGIYGMNFQHMPELSYAWAYPAALGVMLVIGIGMLFYFFRKGWLGSPRARRTLPGVDPADE